MTLASSHADRSICDRFLEPIAHYYYLPDTDLTNVTSHSSLTSSFAKRSAPWLDWNHDKHQIAPHVNELDELKTRLERKTLAFAQVSLNRAAGELDKNINLHACTILLYRLDTAHEWNMLYMDPNMDESLYLCGASEKTEREIEEGLVTSLLLKWHLSTVSNENWAEWIKRQVKESRVAFFPGIPVNKCVTPGDEGICWSAPCVNFEALHLCCSNCTNGSQAVKAFSATVSAPVSYTHLTLPTKRIV